MMIRCKVVLLLFSVLIFYLVPNGGVMCSDEVPYSWIDFMRELKGSIKRCLKSSNPSRSNSTWECFKVVSYEMFDNIMSPREIPLADGIKLVQISNASTSKDVSKSKQLYNWSEQSSFKWPERILNRISETIDTHALQVNLKTFVSGENNSEETTARHRRHRNNMMVAMVFGVTALGSIMVPLGFQFLSVISGKALLLAKLALLLASINGLKRVAASGVHYGLYHVPDNLNYGYYDRGDVHHPRSRGLVKRIGFM